jgi:hypothetical protein
MVLAELCAFSYVGDPVLDGLALSLLHFTFSVVQGVLSAESNIDHSSVTFCTNKVSVCHQLEFFLFLHLIVQTGNSFSDTDLCLYSKHQ